MDQYEKKKKKEKEREKERDIYIGTNLQGNCTVTKRKVRLDPLSQQYQVNKFNNKKTIIIKNLDSNDSIPTNTFQFSHVGRIPKWKTVFHPLVS